MVTKQQESFTPYFFLYILIFLTTIFQGGYFVTGLLILNICFIGFILLNKEPFKVDVSLFLMLALLGIMVVSTIFKSVNVYVAMNEWMKYSLFPLSYVVFSRIKNKERVRSIFFRSFVVLMLFGLLAVLGFSLYSGMVTTQGNRLQSFLQYANTTALFMGIGALFSIDRFFGTRKKLYIVLGIFFGTALLLTQSRTTFVVFLIILGIYMFRLINSKLRIVFVGTLLSLFALLFTFGGRIIKISIFEPTLIERIITFQDAVRILFKETLGMGLGLGNWQFMQFVYQSAPYQVRYIHNFYLQAAMDGGVLALGLLVGLIVFHFVKGYKKNNIYFYLYLFIIIHSFFEVNFNFGIMIIFFTFVLTNLNEPIYLVNRQLYKQFKYFKYFKYLLIVPLTALIIIFVSEIFISNGNAKEKLNKQEAYRLYQSAYTLNPFNNELLFKMAKMERNVDQALAYLEKSYDKNPFDYQVMKALSEGYLYKKDFEKSYFYADALFNIFPYNKQHQLLVEKILKQFYENGGISSERFNQLHSKLKEQITRKNVSINHLYRYINREADY